MMDALRRSWADLPLTQKGMIVIGLPLLIFILAVAFSVLTFREVQHAQARITRAYAQQAYVQNVRTLVLEASGSARASLVTGQNGFDLRFAAARDDLTKLLETPPADPLPERNEDWTAVRQSLERELAALNRLLDVSPTPGDALGERLLLREQAGLLAVSSALDRLSLAQQAALRGLEDEQARLLRNYDRTLLLTSLIGLLAGLVGMRMFASGVTRRVQHLMITARRLARGVATKPGPPSRDELGQLGDTLEVTGRLLLSREGELRQVNGLIKHQFDELTERHQHLVVLNQLAAALQRSGGAGEATEALQTRVAALLPQAQGSLYLFERESRVYRAAWHLGDADAPAALEPDTCLAAPLGRHYAYARDEASRTCAHMDVPYPVASFCLGVAHQGKPLGLLQLRSGAPLSEDVRHILEAMSDRFALSLANLQLQESLREQAIRDPLTGLYNRRHLMERLGHELERVKRSGEPLSLFIADLDHFKRVNDRYGHECGDRALQTFAALLEHTFRAQDIPCRYGGEEFVVVLPGASLADATGRAERLVEQVRALELTSSVGERVPLSVSVGVASGPGHDSHSLIAQADTALYRAKDLGRDRVVAFEPDIDLLLAADPRD